MTLVLEIYVQTILYGIGFAGLSAENEQHKKYHNVDITLWIGHYNDA